MIRVIFAEWRKLRRPSLFFSTMGAVMAFTALVTSLTFLLLDSRRGGGGGGPDGRLITRASLELPHGLSVGFSGSAAFLGLIALCVFAANTAQEYTYGTLRNLLVRQPRRITLLLGKFLAMASFALLSVALSAIVGVSLAYGLSGKAKVLTAAWSTTDARSALLHAFVNVFISVLAFGTIGMLLGLLFRSPISSISLGVAWLLVVENIIAAFVKHSGKWLPGQLMSSIASGGDINSSYSHAVVVLCAYLALGSVIVGTLFKRRDVAN
jgi:ABC-2 type transport system permease protein